jgi:hypothetical protein
MKLQGCLGCRISLSAEEGAGKGEEFRLPAGFRAEAEAPDTPDGISPKTRLEKKIGVTEC